MPPDMFWDIAWKIGVPFVLVSIALLAFYRNDVVTKKSYDLMCGELQKSYDAMVIEKDRQISREQDLAADLWGILKPTIQVGRGALDRLETGKAKR